MPFFWYTVLCLSQTLLKGGSNEEAIDIESGGRGE